MEIFNSWIFYIFAFLYLITGFNIFFRLSAKNSNDAGALIIVLQIMAAISALIYVPFFQWRWPADNKIVLMLSLACFFYAINDRLQASARQHLSVATYSIISQIYTVFLILSGVLFFNETTSITKLFGALLIILGNVFLLYEKGKLTLNKYINYAILAALVLAGAMTIDVGISQQFNLAIYIALTLTIPAIILKIFERKTIKEIQQEFNSNNKKFMILTSLCWSSAIMCVLKSFQLGQVSIVAPLQATSVLLSVLASHFILKETQISKKLLAAIIVFVGIWLTVR